MRIIRTAVAILALGTIAALAQPTTTAPDFTSIKGKILAAQNFKSINAQTGTSYTVLDSDRGKLVTLSNGSAIAVTLPQAGAASSFITGWWGDFYTGGVGTVTITPTTSTINGASTLVLTTGQSAHCVSNGTNYFCEVGKSAGSGTVTSMGIVASTATISGTCTVTTSGTCNVPSQTAVTSWTPVVTTTGTVGTPAYSVQVGSYVQNGPLVTVFFDVQLSGWTGSPTGNVEISGLPVTSGATSNDFGACNIHSFSVATSFSSFLGRVAPSVTNITLLTIPAGGATTSSLLTAAQAGTGLVIAGSCAYHI